METELLDYNKTILKGRLIFKKKFDMILNIASFAMLLGFIGFVFSLMILKQNIVEWIIAWALVAIISIGLSILKWNYSMRIMKINTGKSKNDNYSLVKRFVDKRGFKYQSKNNNYVQTISNSGILWFRMEFNFIIQEDDVFINVNYFDSKVNWPSFYGLKKYINEFIIETNASAQQRV